MPVYVRFTFHAYGNVFFIKVRKKNVRPVKIPNNSFIRFILKKKKTTVVDILSSEMSF